MTESLRPMNLGGILDRGVQVYRARFLVFFELGFIHGLAQLAYRVASVHPKLVTTGDTANHGLVLLSYTASFVTWLASLFLDVVVSAAICLAASRVNLGEEITFHEAFGTFTSKAWRLVGLSILQGIFAGWPIIIAAIVGVVISTSGGPAFVVGFVFILGGIPCLVLYTRYALAYPATAIEGLRAGASIDRSVNLSEGGRWRIFWGIVVPLVPSLMLIFGVAGLMQALKHGNALLANNPLLVAGINGVVGLIVALVFTPYASIVHTLLYYDQRMRREGFDVERMMEAAGLGANAALPGGGE